MKEVQYPFQVPDFCPERCEALSPFRYDAAAPGIVREGAVMGAYLIVFAALCAVAYLLGRGIRR